MTIDPIEYTSRVDRGLSERVNNLEARCNLIGQTVDRLIKLVTSLMTHAPLQKIQDQKPFVVVDPSGSTATSQSESESEKKTAVNPVKLDRLRDIDVQFTRAVAQYEEWIVDVPPSIPKSVIDAEMRDVMLCIARKSFIDGWILGNIDDRNPK